MVGPKGGHRTVPPPKYATEHAQFVTLSSMASLHDSAIDCLWTNRRYIFSAFIDLRARLETEIQR